MLIIKGNFEKRIFPVAFKNILTFYLLFEFVVSGSLDGNECWIHPAALYILGSETLSILLCTIIALTLALFSLTDQGSMSYPTVPQGTQVSRREHWPAHRVCCVLWLPPPSFFCGVTASDLLLPPTPHTYTLSDRMTNVPPTHRWGFTIHTHTRKMTSTPFLDWPHIAWPL